MILYSEDDNKISINESNLEQLKAEELDLYRKIRDLDMHFHHKDFLIKNDKGEEISFDKFLAKDILNAVRKVLTEKAVHREKYILDIEEKIKKDS